MGYSKCGKGGVMVSSWSILLRTWYGDVKPKLVITSFWQSINKLVRMLIIGEGSASQKNEY